MSTTVCTTDGGGGGGGTGAMATSIGAATDTVSEDPVLVIFAEGDS